MATCAPDGDRILIGSGFRYSAGAYLCTRSMKAAGAETLEAALAVSVVMVLCKDAWSCGRHPHDQASLPMENYWGACHLYALTLNPSPNLGRGTLSGFSLLLPIWRLSTHQLPMLFFSAVRPPNPPILGDFNSSFPQILGGLRGAMQQFVGSTGDGCT